MRNILLTLLCFICFSPLAEDSKNILKNGDFSRGKTSWKGENISKEKDPDKKSNIVILLEKNTSKKSGNNARIGQAVKFPRKKLTVKVSIKARIESKGKTKLTLAFPEKSHGRGGKQVKLTELSGAKWQDFSVIYKLDNTNGKAKYLFIRTDAGNPAIFLDDIIMTYKVRSN